MGKTKLSITRESYVAKTSPQQPEQTLRRAVDEVRAERRQRDKILVRTGFIPHTS